LELSDYLEKFPSLKVKKWKASVLNSGKRYKEAIVYLNNEILSQSPNDLGSLIILAESYQYNEQFEEALKTLKEISKLDENSINTQVWRATILKQLKRYQESYDELLALSKKYPDDFNVKNALSKSSAALGLGDHAMIRNEITAVPLSDRVMELKAKYSTIALSGEKDDGYRVDSLILAKDVDKSGRTKKTRYVNMTVLKNSGVSSLSMQSIHFNPIYEKIYINKVIVRNNGEIAYQGKVNELFISDQSTGLETHDKELNIPLKSLEIGSQIELVCTIESWGKENTIPFKNRYLGSRVSSRFEAIEFSGDIETLKTHCSIPINVEETKDTKIFWQHGIGAYRSEVFSPKLNTTFCEFSYGDNTTTWEKVSKNYYDHIKQRFDGSDTLDKAIDNILLDSKTEEEKMKSAVYWVQHHCVYRGIEFGPRGRMPSKAEVVIKEKSGDCKDKSLILWHMFKKLGIKSHLALAHTSKDIIENIPSEDQFNHIVLYCPNLAHKIIDPTIDDLNLLEYAPYSMVDNYILPVTEKGHGLVKVMPTKDAIRLDSSKKIEFKENKMITTDTVIFYGYAASYYRSIMRGRAEKEKYDLIYGLLSDFYPDISIESLEVVSGIDVYQKPFTLKVVYETEASEEVPTPFEQIYLKVRPSKDRANRISTRFPTVINSEINCPEEYTLKLKKDFTQNPYTEMDTEVNKNKIIVRSEVKIVDAKSKEFQNFRDNVISLIPEVMVVSEEADINQ